LSWSWEAIVVTLREVAERAGVSMKTVSRIVNGEDAVAPQMRQHVLGWIEALNYVPNNAARQMRRGTSTIFGLMTDAVATTPYSVDIVRGAQSALDGDGQTLLIASNDGDPAKEAALWRTFQAHGAAGVVYAAMFHRPHDLGTPAFRGPITLANCFAVDGEAASIIPDDEGGGYTQARTLLELGHRDIAAVTLVPQIEATRLRGEGFRRAFADFGLSFDESRERRGMQGELKHEQMIAFEVARDLLGAPGRPTAIICGNDQIAVQVYCAAFSLGLSIPEDLSVIGFDDMKVISETLYPRLTTVALPYFDIGRRAVELLLSTERAGEAGTGPTLIPCPLVVRESCRRIG
jgi:LacI family transcriptional regulator